MKTALHIFLPAICLIAGPLAAEEPARTVTLDKKACLTVTLPAEDKTERKLTICRGDGDEVVINASNVAIADALNVAEVGDGEADGLISQVVEINGDVVIGDGDGAVNKVTGDGAPDCTCRTRIIRYSGPGANDIVIIRDD